MMRTVMLAVLVGAAVGVIGVAHTQAAPSPAGDIPDTQVFVTYRSAHGGYALEVPEGWARTVQEPNVRFISGLDGLEVTVTRSAGSPALASVRDQGVATLKQTEPGVTIQNVQTVRLPGGPAVLVAYTSTSTPDPVTGKRSRLKNQAYLFSKSGATATLQL